MPGIVEERSEPRIVRGGTKKPARRTPIPSPAEVDVSFSGLPLMMSGATYNCLGGGEHGDGLEDRRLELRWLRL
jgi:hypothetical protein